MLKLTHILPRWLPALLMMLIIFLFSSQPSSIVPDFGWADALVKKGAHMIGYAMLAWSYWYAFRMHPGKRGLAWLLAMVYAVTDELHQSFVPGRYSSVWDVLIFDSFGALISLWLTGVSMKTTRWMTGTSKQ